MQILTLRSKDFESVDKFVLWAFMLLSAIGVVAVYSAISYLAATKGDGDTEALLFKHLFRVGLALLAMGVFSMIDYRLLAKWSRVMLIISIVMLIAVQVVGIVSGGAARWLNLAGVIFQPSDMAKVSLVLYVSTLLAQKQVYIKSFSRTFAPIFVWILLTIGAIGISDLSTAAVLLVCVLVMCFIARVSVLHISMVGVLGLVLAYVMLLGSPERAARIESFVGMKLFPHTVAEKVLSVRDEGYQSHQAKIAIALGGLTGVGPGKSTQKHFLPAPYNDFIYAIIAEEYGIIGAFVLLGLFLLILFRGLLRIARHAPDPLGLFLAVGVVVMFSLYGFVHAGVSSNLLPVTGLALPFVSYGGTSLLANGIMAGILLNISRQIA
uniref:peptidoglycan glycosyltransferase n=1 Tax=uncultured marine microorganism HF4000_APKG2M17 TaxID=455548 RepID=B3T6T9_9ZZZZ|nr:putative cell cycle protein [uncultured marine microorganism HF4000_APKG2M17]